MRAMRARKQQCVCVCERATDTEKANHAYRACEKEKKIVRERDSER